MRGIIILTIAFVLIGCSGKSKNHSNESFISLQEESIERFNNGKDLFIVADSCKLECNNKCLISDVKHVMANDSYIIIIDKQDPLPIVFDRNGKFLYKIGKHGRGPGEIERNGWTVLTDSMIMVLVFPNYIINCYTFDNHFIREIDPKKTKFLFTKFHWSDPDLFLIHEYFVENSPVLAKYSVQTNSLSLLWMPDENILKKRPITDEAVFYQNYCTFSNKNSLFCCSDEYKISFWMNDVKMGYFTNQYYEYEFLSTSNISSEDYWKEAFNHDRIRDIFLINDSILIVDIDSPKALSNKTVKIGNIIAHEGNSGFYDLIDIKNNRIYSRILNSHNLRIINTFDNSAIAVKHNLILPNNSADSLQNPSIMFYKLNLN
ncbi:MAG: 6-bladed beta-propeller [Candidatus Delongbacteria bacterium]|nr:6-bladed beta-propeller [Candidatus Delongbacteria bacterium]